MIIYHFIFLILMLFLNSSMVCCFCQVLLGLSTRRSNPIYLQSLSFLFCLLGGCPLRLVYQIWGSESLWELVLLMLYLCFLLILIGNFAFLAGICLWNLMFLIFFKNFFVINIESALANVNFFSKLYVVYLSRVNYKYFLVN